MVSAQLPSQVLTAIASKVPTITVASLAVATARINCYFAFSYYFASFIAIALAIAA